MSTGALGYAGVGIELASDGTSGSQSGSATIVNYIPIVSENLIITRQDLDSQNIQALWDTERVYNGLQSVAGTIVTQAHPLASGLFLRSAFDVNTSQPGAGFGAPTYATSHANVRSHRFTTKQTQFQAGSGSDLPTLTFEINRGPAMGVGSSFVYYNCAGNVMEFQIQAGQLARFSFDFIGRDYGGIPKTTPSFPAIDAFLWSQCSLSIGGNASTLFEQITVRLDNGLVAVPKLDGRLRPDLIKRNNFRQIQVNGQLQFQTYSEYDRFLGGSETPMKLVFRSGGLPSTAGNSNYNTLVLDIPSMRYTAFPLNIAGPGQIGINFTGRGMYNQLSGTALDVTVVNTRVPSYEQNSTG